MSKIDIVEALYALPDGVVVPRRKSCLIPLVILLAGVLLFVVNNTIPKSVDYTNLKSAVVLFGAVFVILGVVLLVLRMGKGGLAPFHAKDGCFLAKRVLKFEKQKQAQVVEFVKSGDIESLCNMPTDDVSVVTVVVYSSPKSSFCAVQPYEYHDFELHPLCGLKVIC